MMTTDFEDTPWLKTQTPGHEEHLYHYTSAKILELILNGGTVQFGPLSLTNDPAENKEWVAQLFFSSTHSGSTLVSTDELDGTLREIDRLLRRNACLGCFTLDREPNPEALGSHHYFHMGWARARMWQQYGGAHQGVVLVFNRVDFLECVEIANRASGEARERSWGRVKYFDWPQDMQFALDAIRRRSILELLEDFRTSRGVSASLYFRKNTDWESEVEFRVINLRTSPRHDQDDAAMMIPFAESLEAIIVGEHFDDSVNHQLLIESGVPVYRCVWLDGAPTLARN